MLDLQFTLRRIEGFVGARFVFAFGGTGDEPLVRERRGEEEAAEGDGEGEREPEGGLVDEGTERGADDCVAGKERRGIGDLPSGARTRVLVFRTPS